MASTDSELTAFHVVPPLADVTTTPADPSPLVPTATHVVEPEHDTPERSLAAAGVDRLAQVTPPLVVATARSK